MKSAQIGFNLQINVFLSLNFAFLGQNYAASEYIYLK